MSDRPAPLPPGSRKAQDLGGYAELSVDDLDRIMLTGEDPVAKALEDAAEEADEDAEETVEEETADETDEDDSVSEEDSEETSGDDEEKETEESPLEKRIRLLERRLELEGLERSKETEARKRAELIASKQAGRAGFLAQQLKKSPSKAQPKADVDDDEDNLDSEENATQENRQEQNQPSLDPRYEEDRAELVTMAINDEGQLFAKSHAEELEEMPEKFVSRLQELMKEEAAPYVEEFKTSSVKTVRKLARSLMNSAYATARIEFADTVAENAQAEASTRKAESVGKSKRRKAKAAISKGGAKASKKAPSPKTYEDMTDEELELEMQKEYGDNYRLGSDRNKHGGL